MFHRRIGLGLACIGMFAALSAALVGQEGNRQRGGPGGGFMGRGGGDPTIMLLGMDEVHKELELVDDQQSSLKKLHEELTDMLPRPTGFRELAEAEQEKMRTEMQQKMQEVSKVAKAKLADILLPHQQERLRELTIQYRRTGALRDEEVAKTLELTGEQKQKLETLQQEIDESTRTKMRELFQAGGGGGGGGGQEGFREKFAEIQKENDVKLLAVLTDSQKKKFDEIKGKPFDFPRMAFGGGRGRPGNRDRKSEKNN